VSLYRQKFKKIRREGARELKLLKLMKRKRKKQTLRLRTRKKKILFPLPRHNKSKKSSPSQENKIILPTTNRMKSIQTPSTKAQ